jgi:hypothetical protein
MVRFMTAARLGVVALLAIAILGTWGAFSFFDVSATGRGGVSNVPALFKDKDNNGGNNGQGGNGNGNGDAGQDDEKGGDNGHADKDKKDKKDKSDKAKDQADDADEDEDGKSSANVDCDDVEGMIEYLKDRNLNGAIHANENGADNAAAGALNKCMEHGPENGDDDSEDGTPVAEDDGTPVAVDGTPVGEDDADEDKPVTVNVEIDEDGNGVIEYDLDGDGEVDLTMIVEDGKVTSIVETGAEDGTPEASPESA